MESFKNYKIHARFRWLYERSFHFIWKRMTFGWEGLGFGALQYTIFATSCLTLVFAAF